MSFFDEISGIVSREMTAARLANDTDRKAEVIEALASLLGRTIAISANGDGRTIETLCMGCDAQIILEATSFAAMIREVEGYRNNGELA